jgi:SpoIID/LytB domain protein
MHVRDYPYYTAPCAYCRRHPETWVAHVSEGPEKNLAVQHTEHARLQLARSLGWSVVPGNSYTVRNNGKDLVLSGTGVGHGLGLCQRGAAAMARSGATFQEILLHYYPNTMLKLLEE